MPVTPLLSPVSQENPSENQNYLRAALAILISTSLLRWWYSTHIDLVADEAYYWVWSKHLAASYRDKGPAIAWVIALGTRLFGDNIFGVRFFAVLFSACTGWQLFTLARRIGGERTALWCLILVNIVPLLSVGSLLMTIDVLSLFFWAWGMNVFWTAIHTRKIWQWAGLGAIIGLGFLAKFTNGLQIISIALFLLGSKSHRTLFFSRQSIVAGLAFLITILPLLWWNLQTDWVHVAALHSRSGVEHSFQIHPLELLRFIGGQILVLSPLIGIGLIVAVADAWRKHRNELETHFLLSHFLPVYAVFGFFSINIAGKENWPAPALLAGTVILTIFWQDLIARKPSWRWITGIAVGLSLLLTIVFHNTDFLHLPNKLEPLRRARGWEDFAAHVQRARKRYQPTLLIGNHYSQASIMQFYLPDHPITYLPEKPYGQDQFTLWPTYHPKEHTRVLFVTNKTSPPPESVRREFPKCQIVDDFWSMHQGREMTRFQIYLCQAE